MPSGSMLDRQPFSFLDVLHLLYIFLCHAKDKSSCPLRGFSVFMRLPFSLIRCVPSGLLLCRGDGGYDSPSLASVSSSDSASWISVGNRCYSGWMPSMLVSLIVGRSQWVGEAPFISGRVHFPVVPAPFLFWMPRSSVVGRLNVCLSAVAMMVVNVAAEVRTDCVVRYATSRRLSFASSFLNRLVEALIFPLQI